MCACRKRVATFVRRYAYSSQQIAIIVLLMRLFLIISKIKIIRCDVCKLISADYN